MPRKPKHTRQFDTFPEMLAFFDANPPCWNPDNGSDDRSSSNSDWAKTSSFTEAMTLGREGWAEGRNLLHNLADEIDHSSIIVRPASAYELDVAGGYPDIGRAIAGDPVCMFTDIPSERTTKIIRIGVDCTTPSFTSPEDIMARGAAILSYIDALENANWRCELVAVMSTKSGGKTVSVETTLKQAQDYPDLDRLAFALAHPSYLRRMFFRIVESFPDTASFAPGYGLCAGVKPNDVDVWIDRECGRGTEGNLAVVTKAFEEQLLGEVDDEIEDAA